MAGISLGNLISDPHIAAEASWIIIKSWDIKEYHWDPVSAILRIWRGAWIVDRCRSWIGCGRRQQQSSWRAGAWVAAAQCMARQPQQMHRTRVTNPHLPISRRNAAERPPHQLDVDQWCLKSTAPASFVLWSHVHPSNNAAPDDNPRVCSGRRSTQMSRIQPRGPEPATSQK